MKKKPSLLDIELFVQKREDEKQKELSQIEANSGALVIEKGDNVKEAALAKEDKKIVENKNDQDNLYKADETYPEEYNQIEDNQKNQFQPPTAPTIIDERLTSIIEITDSQRDDMNRLKQDMFKLKEQLRVYHSFLSNQQKKILELEKSIADKRFSGEYTTNKGVLDANYSKLLLKNIVWLKEEKDFSSNDVARLFRAEGFLTPHPHENWDEKVINTLYNEAKKSFL
ncbi:MAG: hypothetical protein HQK72_02680 [Desulfamplus sp.]|nr:hypothetical protein [Desulfamplus sp.]